MDHQQQPQSQPNNNFNTNRRRPLEAAAVQNQHPSPQPCPRCQSSNTKFCYYNNYSLSQPRFFCKGCRRYWTQGGTLRNVPVGGGCRKSKRPKLSSSAASASASTAAGGASTSSNPQPQPLPLPQHQMNNPLLGAPSIGISAGSGGGGGPFYGGGFLSALSQPLSFGPNLGLLHGLGLPVGFQQPSPQQNHETSFQQLLEQQRQSNDVYPGNWNLASNNTTSNADNTTANVDNNNRRNDDHPWPDYPTAGQAGLDDP